MAKKEDMRKSMAPKPSKSSVKIKAKRPSPLDAMSAGAASSLPMGPSVGLRPGMPGMKCGGKVKKMAGGGITKAKMGSVKTAAPSRDGMATKGKTKGKQVVMKGGKPLGMCGGGMAKGKK